MYLYNKTMFDKMKYFPGLENIEQNYSQSFQDLFVLSMLNGKRNGSFLEIGGFHPSFLSNTYLLEKSFDWKGISIDIDWNVGVAFRNERPNTGFIVADAVGIDYSDLLKAVDRVDYLSLDIEPSSQTLACLKRMPLDKTRFSVITYETDFYDPKTPKEESLRIREESRNILKSNGYVLVAGNISNLTDDAPFEDWYVDGYYISRDIINKFVRQTDESIASHKYMLGGENVSQ